MLRKCCQKDNANWDKYVPLVLFAYREVPHQTTEFSPFKLLYGYLVRGPLDVLKTEMIGDHPRRDVEKNVAEYVTNMSSRMLQTAIAVQETVSESQERQKTWYDRNARARQFEVSQQVLLLLPSSRNKLSCMAGAIYKALERVSNTTYRIKLGGRRQNSQVYHVNLLRPWFRREDLTLYGSVLTGTQTEIGEAEMEAATEVPVSTTATQTWRTLTEERRAELARVLQRFGDVFSDVPGRASDSVHDVKTTSEQPIKRKAYRMTHSVREWSA